MIENKITSFVKYVFIPAVFICNVEAKAPCLDPLEQGHRKIAIIGDYGHNGADNGNASVAKLVKSVDPELIITLGDNIYPNPGGLAQAKDVIGRHYSEYLGNSSSTRRFYPSIGNHDVENGKLPTYLSYFKPPGNGRYYDFVCGPVHFFSINSAYEPDGNTANSTQAKWLKAKLKASKAKFKVVYFHHPPYSSGYHGPSKHMQWPFKKWDVDVVLSGHEHNYERIERGGVSYVINGLGGTPYLRDFKSTDDESVIRYNKQFGALFLTIEKDSLKFNFETIDGRTIDSFQIDS